MASTEHWKVLGTIEEAIVTVVGDHYGRYGRSLDPSIDLKHDLEGDDVDYLEVVMTLEELFGCALQPLPQPYPTQLRELIALCRGAVGAQER